MTEKERMLAGKLYIANDQELRELRHKGLKLLQDFNQANYDAYELRSNILKEMFGQVGKNIHITPPLYVDYGANVYIGNNFYANTDCTFLDVNKITFGNNVMLGPKVAIYTAGHPIDKDVRNTGLEFGLPIKIGDNVWVGGNTIINPGVTIGDNTIIGSGSVVTKDIPADVIAVGNPCKVLRTINEQDRTYWENEKDKYFSEKSNLK